MRLFKKKEDKNDRDKNRSPAQSENPYAQPVSENPYAQAPQANPYAQQSPDNPYAQTSQDNPYASASASVKPSAYTQARQQAYGDYTPQGGRDTKNLYGNSNEDQKGMDNKSSGYGANQYGAAGYGSDRYGNGDNKTPAPSRYGAGGYGGFGGRDPHNKQDDPNRNALFAGASERATQNKQPGGEPPPYDSGSTGGDYRTSNTNPPGSYNPGPQYQDRQLTAEEEEEESLNATKQEIRATKQKDVSATRNALRLAQQAEEVGRDTLTRLGVQAEYIHSTEQNLDLSHNQNKQAEDKARELKTLNRSMFALHVSNPFTAKSRDASRDNTVRQRHDEERIQRELTRKEQFQAHQRMEKNFTDLSSPSSASAQQQQKQKNLAERSKYQFEADSEDEGMEDEIDGNLDALSGVVRNMQRIAVATGEEVDAQNRRFEKIHEKVRCFCSTLYLYPLFLPSPLIVLFEGGSRVGFRMCFVFWLLVVGVYANEIYGEYRAILWIMGLWLIPID